MRTIQDDFSRLVKNNSKKNWNFPVFRHTMANAFRYNIEERVELLKERIKSMDIPKGKNQVLGVIDTLFSSEPNSQSNEKEKEE